MVMRIGIIGAGIHGARYLKHAAEDIPDLEPVAICRRDAEAGQSLANQWKCHFHTQAEDLIKDPDIDGVIIATPPSTHFAYASASLQSGKSVLLEKPMTGTLVEARQLCDIASAPDSPALMLAQTLRWNPVLMKMKSLLPKIGPVHMIRIVQRLEPTTLAWQRDLKQSIGGSVLLTGVHLFDTVRFLTDREFIEIDSKQENFINPVTEDFFLARARLDDWTFVSMEVSKFTQSRVCLCEIIGEHGQLLGDYYFGGIRMIKGARQEQFDISASTPTLPAVLEAWLKSWEEKTEPPIGSIDGLKTLEIVDACYRSAATGANISL